VRGETVIATQDVGMTSPILILDGLLGRKTVHEREEKYI
jgi:hypothetical protein